MIGACKAVHCFSPCFSTVWFINYGKKSFVMFAFLCISQSENMVIENDGEICLLVLELASMLYLW